MKNKSKMLAFIFGIIIAIILGYFVLFLLGSFLSGDNNILYKNIVGYSLYVIIPVVMVIIIALFLGNVELDNEVQQEPVKWKIPSKILIITLGILAANLFAAIVIGSTSYFFKHYLFREDGIFIFSEFVLVPIGMGIICAWFWRNLGFGTGAYLFLSLLTGLVAIAMSHLFFGEGFICLIIVVPLLFAFLITGTFIGKAMFRRKNNTLNVSVVGLLLILFTFDSISDHHYENEVSDTILVHAPPSEVWKHVVAFERIKEPNHYFLFKIGMPSPVESTVDGYYEGAGRKCIFSNGYTFDEKMVVYIPPNPQMGAKGILTFDVTHQPRDPEIMGHIDILRGQFLLHDNGDGTTTLTGNSWYRLYVFPIWYYDIWAKSITRNVHLRVMQHIKELSEKQIYLSAPNP